MPEPTPKSKNIDDLLTAITGKDRGDSIRNNICTTCSRSAEQFKDALSAKEYTISGMCQACQDSVFGVGEEW